MKTTSCLLLSLLFAGCASAPPTIGKPSQMRETALNKSYLPAIGVEHTVATGDNLYVENQLNAVQTYAVEVMGEVAADMDLGNKLRIRAGKQGELRTTAGGQKAVCWDFVTTSVVTGPSHACLIDLTNAGSFSAAMFATRDRFFPLEKPVAYKTSKLPLEYVATNADFKREILYQGVSKGTVKLSFREFSNDMARPAYTQDILYDLEEDGTALVVFKGLRIKILKATGVSVKYVVQQPFA